MDDFLKPDQFTSPNTKITYTVIKGLGAGGFGEVSIAKGSNDEIVAVKASRTTTKQNELLEYELSFKTEQEFMYKFKHPNILKCLDGFYDTEKKKFVLILEFMQNGSLRTYLANLIHSGKSLLSNERNAMIGQLISALHTMHSVDIMHRDLKDSNILLDKDKNLKVADLGISKQTSFSRAFTRNGDFACLAPESMKDSSVLEGSGGGGGVDENKREFRKESDLFQLGLIIFQITFRLEFSETHPNYFQICKNGNLDKHVEDYFREKQKMYKNYQKEVQVIKGLLKNNPNDRLSLKEIANILEVQVDWEYQKYIYKHPSQYDEELRILKKQTEDYIISLEQQVKNQLRENSLQNEKIKNQALQIQALEAQIGIKDNQSSDLINENEQLKQQLEQFRTIIESREQENQNLKDGIENFQGQNSQLWQENYKLSQSLTQKDLELNESEQLVLELTQIQEKKEREHSAEADLYQSQIKEYSQTVEKLEKQSSMNSSQAKEIIQNINLEKFQQQNPNQQAQNVRNFEEYIKYPLVMVPEEQKIQQNGSRNSQQNKLNKDRVVIQPSDEELVVNFAEMKKYILNIKINQESISTFNSLNNLDFTKINHLIFIQIYPQEPLRSILWTFLWKCKELTHLEFRLLQKKYFNDSGFETLIKTMNQEDSFTKLKSFRIAFVDDMYTNQITDAGLEELENSFRISTLEKFSLEFSGEKTRNKIQDKGLMHLSQIISLNPKLTSLNLIFSGGKSSNLFSQKGLLSLCTALSKCKLLKNVQLKFRCQAVTYSITDQVFDKLCKSLETSVLETLVLDFHGDSINHEISGKGLKSLGSLIESNQKSLVQLEIDFSKNSNQMILDEQLEKLAFSLEKCHLLQILSLRFQFQKSGSNGALLSQFQNMKLMMKTLEF